MFLLRSTWPKSSYFALKMALFWIKWLLYRFLVQSRDQHPKVDHCAKSKSKCLMTSYLRHGYDISKILMLLRDFQRVPSRQVWW